MSTQDTRKLAKSCSNVADTRPFGHWDNICKSDFGNNWEYDNQWVRETCFSDLLGGRPYCKRIGYGGDYTSCCTRGGSSSTGGTCHPDSGNYDKPHCDQAMREFCQTGNRIIHNQACRDWCSQNRNQGSCDSMLLNYCQYNRGDQKCGCALPSTEYGGHLLGPPECVDTRCAGNPSAIRLGNQQNPDCKIVNCVIDHNQLKFVDVDNVDVSQHCGEKMPKVTKTDSDGKTIELDFDDEMAQIKKNKQKQIMIIGGISIVVFILIIVFFVFLMSSK